MGELEDTILDYTKYRTAFAEQRELFQTETWQKIVDILEQARLGILTQFESGNGDTTVCCLRFGLRLIRKLQNLPTETEEAIREIDKELKGLERQQVLNEAKELAFDEGRI